MTIGLVLLQTEGGGLAAHPWVYGLIGFGLLLLLLLVVMTVGKGRPHS